MKTRTRHVVCWVEPYFELLDVSTFCHVLSLAGSNWNWRPYRLSMASRAGGLVASRSQVSVNTIPLAICDEPDLVVLGPGEPDPKPEILEAPFASWRERDATWIALRDSTTTLLRLGVPVKTLAASGPRQPDLRKLSASIEFTAKDFHFEGQVLSCATQDVLPAVLALIEQQIGRTARRFVETQMGLSHAAIDIQGLGKLLP